MVTTGKIKDRVADSNWRVYVLKLEEEKFYIGVTVDVKSRFQEHVQGDKKGSSWTSQYKPIEVIEVIDPGTRILKEAMKVEDRITVRYMNSKGSRNVRGVRFLGSDKQVLRKYVNNSHTMYV